MREGESARDEKGQQSKRTHRGMTKTKQDRAQRQDQDIKRDQIRNQKPKLEIHITQQGNKVTQRKR